MACLRLTAGVLGLAASCCAPHQTDGSGERDGEHALEPASGVLETPGERLQPASAATLDEEIAGVVVALDGGWADQARLALGRATDRRVKDFAALVLARRGASEARTQPVRSPLSETLSAEAARAHASLLVEDWRDFDRAYLDEQIRSYDEALRLIDERLLPREPQGAPAALLQDYRRQLSLDLGRARELRTALGD